MQQNLEDAPEPPVDAPSASAKPLLELGYEVTWSELLASVANERELSCINDAIDDEDLPDSFLDGAVMDETRHIGGWPTWHREILSIEVGDNHWPHQVWRCLEPATAAALYITIRLEELARTEGISIADSDAACIMRLPDDPDLSTSVSESLGTEYSLDDGEDSLAILAELDGRVVDPRLLPCLSEVVTTVVGSVLAELLGDELSEDERYCMLNVLVDETTSGRLDVLPLFGDDVTDAYIDKEFIPALHASLETCSPSEAVEPGTTPEAAPGTETTSVAEMFADMFGERAQRALEAAERAEEEAGASPDTGVDTAHFDELIKRVIDAAEAADMHAEAADLRDRRDRLYTAETPTMNWSPQFTAPKRSKSWLQRPSTLPRS